MIPLPEEKKCLCNLTAALSQMTKHSLKCAYDLADATFRTAATELLQGLMGCLHKTFQRI